jgi:hypothetical protein
VVPGAIVISIGANMNLSIETVMRWLAAVDARAPGATSRHPATRKEENDFMTRLLQ